MKRGRIIAGIAVVLILGLAVYLFPDISGKDKEISKSISLVPVNANLVVEIRETEELIDFLKTRPSYWEDLTSTKPFARLNNQILWLDSISSSHDAFQRILSENSLIASIHDIGKRKLGCLFVAELPETMKQKNLEKDIQSLHDITDIHQRVYENRSVFDVTVQGGKKITYSIIRGNLVFSSNSLLVEDAIRQSTLDGSLLDDREFRDVYATAGIKELANVYVNFSRLDHLLAPFIKPSIGEKNPGLEHYASWAELDLSLEESLITLNGFALASDSTLSYLGHISEQPPTEAGFESILPENTAMFYAMSVGNSVALSKYRNAFLEEHHHARYYEDNLKEFNSVTGFEFADLINSLTDDQVCFAVSNINQLDIYQNSYLLLKTQSASEAEKRIEEFIRTYTRHTQQDKDKYISTLVMDASHSYTVYRFPITNWPEILFGSFFAPANPEYCVLLENTIIFASDTNSLKRLLNDYLLNRSIAKNKHYQEFKQNLSREYQTYFYLNTGLGFSWFSMLLNPGVSKKANMAKEVIQKHQQIAIQQIVSDDMVYHNVAIKHRKYQYEKPHTIWESRLDTAMTMKPKIVKNHKSGEKELFIQDEKNNIYLINHKGHILWKMPLNEPIISDVHQIDRYRNDKLQYLFNTRSRIYLIDRMGNHVERFPVNLRSPASCGLALFDYDNNRRYRILVPAENRVVYMYNKEGNLVPGWEFEQSEYAVRQTPQHIRNGKNDYVVFHDKYRIYLLNRRGETRLQPKQQFAASTNNRFYFEEKPDKTKSRLVTTNKRGTVMSLYMDGTIDSTHIREYSNEHYFMFRDLDGDRNPDYIFLDKDHLDVYSQSKKQILNYKFDNEIKESPGFYAFSSKNRKIGIVDKESNLIYLINADGELHPGFPLTGISPFSITHLSTGNNNFNLFVGGNNYFLYNYEVK